MAVNKSINLLFLREMVAKQARAQRNASSNYDLVPDAVHTQWKQNHTKHQQNRTTALELTAAINIFYMPIRRPRVCCPKTLIGILFYSM